MSDLRSGYDEDSLPWLQEVEDEDAPSGISGRAMLIGLVAALVVAAAVAAIFFWLGRQDPATGAPELIRAPAEPYKVKPEDPGGLDIAGSSRTTYETSAGQDVDSRLNLEGAGGQDEGETTRGLPSNETKEPLPAESPAPPAPKPAPRPAPKPAPGGEPGSVVQLGAFGNTAQAERAWTALSARFDLLSGLTKMIVPYSANGKSGYRLRAAASSPEAARQACRAIEAGGESCFVAR
ncbi:MAG TPA: SPOR domain-containing protein [Sphingomicrobium sp.]|nr:SPOR domain-containing protein [Sphingomicrobium sp.]